MLRESRPPMPHVQSGHEDGYVLERFILTIPSKLSGKFWISLSLRGFVDELSIIIHDVRTFDIPLASAWIRII